MFKRKRGIALFTVLTVAMFMTMLTLAMVGNHQSNFAMLTDSINLRQAQLAASSGLDYAKYRLELNRDWGEVGTGFTASTKVWGGNLEIREIAGTNRIEGKWIDSTPPRTFTVNITNYLKGGAGANDRPGTKAVRINTVGTCGAFQLKTEVVLTEAPLYDSAACSDGKMDLSQVTNWNVDSKDTLRNWVRSNTEVDTPDFLGSGTLNFLKSACKSPGVVWSKGDIFIGDPATGADVANVSLPPKNMDANAITAKTSAQMAAFSSLNYNIYDLKQVDLKKPALNQPVPAGNYTISKYNVTYTDHWWEWDWGSGWYVANAPGATMYKDLVYTDTTGNQKHYMYGETPLPKNGMVDDWWVWRDGVNTPAGTTQLFPSKGSVVNISSNFTTDNLNFDFKTYNFNAANNATLNVTGGDLKINSAAPLPADDGSLIPKVAFAPTGTPGFMIGSGNVTLQGSVIGKGGVAATNDLTLAANSNLAVDKDTQLVLWAGKDLTFDVNGGQDMTFNGLIYCKNSVLLKFIGGVGTRLNSLSTTGSLVAQTGSIKMMDATTVNMTYDPSYLNLFTNGLPSGTARFVQVSYKIVQ